MKKIHNILIVFILFISVNTVFGQLSLEQPSSARYPSDLKANDKIVILQKVDSVLNQYTRIGQLLDVKKKKVTDASASEFYKLFTPNAKIVKDYEENIPLDFADPKGYANSVYNFFTLQGLQFKVEKAVLESIDDDKSFYIVTVNIEKVMYSSLNGKREVKITSGRFLNQKMRFDILKTDLSRIKISEIARACKGRECLAADDYIRYLNFSPTFNIGLGAAPLSSYWKETHGAKSSLSIKPGLGFSMGADWVSNQFSPAKSVKKALFVTAGLRYQYQVVNTTLDKFSSEFATVSEADANGIKGNFTRIVDSLYLKEKASFQIVKLPVGVSFRLTKGRKSAIHIAATVSPGFVFSASNEILVEGNNYSKGTFDAKLTKELRALESLAFKNPLGDDLKPFDVGYQLPLTSGEKGSSAAKVADFKRSGFIMGVSLSPSYYYEFDDNDESWGVMAGIDINYQLSSLFKHNNVNAIADEPLKNSYGYKGSLAEYYATGTNPLSLGFRIGVYQKIQKQP